MAHEGHGYDSRTASVYGRETHYEGPGSRSYSPIPAPPGYQSGRNSPAFANSRPASIGNYTQSRPVTNYLDMPIRTGSPMGSPLSGSGQPSDDELEQAIRNILTTADLNKVTKKNIRQQLEERFGCDLVSRKKTINEIIDRVIAIFAA